MGIAILECGDQGCLQGPEHYCHIYGHFSGCFSHLWSLPAWFWLKAGCLTLGIIFLILELLNIVFTCFLLSFLTSSDHDGAFELEDGKVGHEVFIGSCVLTIILSTISVTTNTLLIVGVCTVNYNFIYPTLIWIPALFIINIVGLVVFVLLANSDVDATILIDIFVQLVIVSLCWLCVHSYWQQVKLQRGAPQRLEMTEEATLPPS